MFSNLFILYIIYDSKYGTRNTTSKRNKINTRSKSKQTKNQISINNEAHLNAHLQLIMLC
jgi:hypothetical protein